MSPTRAHSQLHHQLFPTSDLRQARRLLEPYQRAIVYRHHRHDIVCFLASGLITGARWLDQPAGTILLRVLQQQPATAACRLYSTPIESTLHEQYVNKLESSAGRALSTCKGTHPPARIRTTRKEARRGAAVYLYHYKQDRCSHSSFALSRCRGFPARSRTYSGREAGTQQAMPPADQLVSPKGED